MLVTYQTRCTINILQHLYNVMLVVVKSPFHFFKEEEKNTSISNKLILSPEFKCTPVCIQNVGVYMSVLCGFISSCS